MSRPTIGVIGIGRMGNPMARNLLKAGYRVNVYDVRPGAYHNLLELGAFAQGSPAALGQASDLTLLSLLDANTVETVLFGPDGLAASRLEGKIVVDTSTYAPSDTRRFAARLGALGAAMLDAPLTGGEAGARAGSLNIMVGGDAAVLEQARPALEALGTTIVHVGPSGAGQVAKMVNQMLMGGLYVLISEAFAFAEHENADVERILEAIETGGAQSRQLSQMGRLYLEAQSAALPEAAPDGDHYLQVYSKDLYCVLQQAHTSNSYTPVAALTHEVFKQALRARYPGAWPIKLLELWRDRRRTQAGNER